MSAPKFLLLLALIIGGCASSGERDPVRRDACFDCGRIIDISQQAPAQAHRALAAPAASGSLRRGGLGGLNLGSVAVPDVAAPASGFDTRVYSVQVLLDSGGLRSVLVDDPFGLAIGSRVRLIGNQILLDHTRAADRPGAD